MRETYLTKVIGNEVVATSYFKRVYGTGFKVRYKDATYYLTNRHVCMAIKGLKGKPLSSITIDGNVESILAMDSRHDICLVKCTNCSGGLKLASSYNIDEKIVLIGHPRGQNRTFREGRIVTKGSRLFNWLPMPFMRSFLKISAIAYPGNSGSPVVNKWGNVVGILFAGDRAYHTEAYVVPLEEVVKFLSRYINE